MTYRTLRSQLDKRPFEPFRVVMNNGKRFEVRHPEVAYATTSELYVFRPVIEPDQEVVPDQIETIIDVHNISSIEPVREKAA